MPIIDTNLMRIVIDKLKTDATVINFVAKDKNSNLSIRPGDFIKSGALFPMITVNIKEDDSEPKFPACKDVLTITIWLSDKTPNGEFYKKLNLVKDQIISLFNREGGSFNQIDVATNTGYRVCQFLKNSANIEHDDILDLFYCEIIFDVVRSEDETFLVSDAGDRPWQ